MVRKPKIIKDNFGLSPKHKLFCDTYLANGLSNVEAYITVYKPKKPVTANVNASRLLSSANIKQYLDSEKQKLSETLGITKKSQLEKLAKIHELALIPDMDGKTQLTAGIKAIEIQNKMLGLDAPTKLELSGKDGESIKIDASITLLVDRLQDSEND